MGDVTIATSLGGMPGYPVDPRSGGPWRDAEVPITECN